MTFRWGGPVWFLCDACEADGDVSGRNLFEISDAIRKNHDSQQTGEASQCFARDRFRVMIAVDLSNNAPMRAAVSGRAAVSIVRLHLRSHSNASLPLCAVRKGCALTTERDKVTCATCLTRMLDGQESVATDER